MTINVVSSTKLLNEQLDIVTHIPSDKPRKVVHTFIYIIKENR